MPFSSYLKPWTKKGAEEPLPPTARPGTTEIASPLHAGTRQRQSGATTPRFSSSRPSSSYPQGDFRNLTAEDTIEIKADVMVNWLHQQQLERMWTTGGWGEGVILKKSKDAFTACPSILMHDRMDLFDAIRALNVRAAMTVNTMVIKLFLTRPDVPYIHLEDNLRLQILPSVSFLPQCQKHHFAAFIQDSGLLIVWDDDPRHLLARADSIERHLMRLAWKPPNEEEEKEKSAGKKEQYEITEVPVEGSDGDVEQVFTEAPRKLKLNQAVITACTLILLLSAMGSGFRLLSVELAVDQYWIRLALVAVAPLQMWLALFFMQIIMTSTAQILGPIGQMNENTKHYSGRAPPRILRHELPHVTIQCPVYKEGLKAVIEPTVRSLKAAISTYEMQGGTANIFVNDDGMQIIPDEDGQARRDFYEENNIGWVARPKHSPKPENGEKAFIRPGKFKKASNMNYALNVSARVEDRLATYDRPIHWSGEDEQDAYYTCLEQVISEDEGRTWAEGNVRVGDYILLVDSDTRVPGDCLLDAVNEMEQSPQVAIIQMNSGVLNVTDSFFERGITFFTNLIYTAIAFAVANGDVAPFVGHNAFLRWAAIQSIGYDEDGVEKYWSEKTVSEDFDMALRLQTAGYVLRFGAYSGDGFKEGVSLTVYDELARWEKYAYGCTELIFHPFRYWLTRGPFTKLFRDFITSSMPLPSKITIMAYVGTYYAIGITCPLFVANYFLIGWYNTVLDHYYIDSFKIFFSVVIVFTALGNFALGVLRYRLGVQGLLEAMWTNYKWVLLLAVFLGGLSLHVSQAILSHLLSINMTWGATAKEVEDTTFFKEVPKLLRKFKGTFAFCFLAAATMVTMAVGVPYFWTIDTFVAVFPLANIVLSHFLLPIALNPSLMLFTW